MIKKLKCTTVTNLMGGQPAMAWGDLVGEYIKDLIAKGLLPMADREKKKGETAIEYAARILKVFHRADGPNSSIILGNWMLKRCLISTANILFNAMTNKTHPNREKIKAGIRYVKPFNILLTNGNGSFIDKADGVQVFGIRGSGTNKQAFTAYEYLKYPILFEAEVLFDEAFLKEEHIDTILDSCGSIGVYSFRERFGKFSCQHETVG